MARNSLSPRNRKALKATRRILNIAERLRSRHEARTERTSDGGDIIAGLFDKAVKTVRAILVLVNRGYPEDGIVLARSLAALAIDLAYLSANDRDRIQTYRAVGRDARKQIAEQSGAKPPDADAEDWPEIKERAKRWKRPGAIRERATKGKSLSLYDYAYRHGSSFEHSDAWSLQTYDPENKWAREVVLNLALLVAAAALGKTLESWARFSKIEDKDAEKKVETWFLYAFGGRVTSSRN